MVLVMLMMVVLVVVEVPFLQDRLLVDLKHKHHRIPNTHHIQDLTNMEVQVDHIPLLTLDINLLAVVVLNFLLIQMAPGDPVSVIVGEMGGASEELIARMRAEYGLDQPLLFRGTRCTAGAWSTCGTRASGGGARGAG